MRGWWTQLRSLQLSRTVLALAAVGMLISWLSDISVLLVHLERLNRGGAATRPASQAAGAGDQ